MGDFQLIGLRRTVIRVGSYVSGGILITTHIFE